MNHTEFIKIWNNKYYNYDTVYWPECVDLFKGYYRDVKSYVISVALWTADNYFKNIEKTGLVRTDKPKEWDVVFSKYKQGKVELWHVGIFERYDSLNWVSGWYQFDQLGNWEVVGGESPCKSRFYPDSKLNWFATLTDEVEERVQRFVTKYYLKQPSKEKPYTQYETCIILSKIDEATK